MKREIKFRGQRITGEWIYGSLIVYGERTFIYPINGSQEDYHFYGYEVLPETVGQFVGLEDKNGKEIYEGDTVKIPDLEFIDFIDNGTSSPDEKYEDGIVEIFFDEGGFCFNHPNTDTPCPIFYNIKDTEIVAAQ